MSVRNKDLPSVYDINADALSDLVTAEQKKQVRSLRKLGGVAGIAKKLKVSLTSGISQKEIDAGATGRIQAFGTNVLPDPPYKNFFELLWEGFQDSTIIILSIAAAISLGFGLAFPPDGEAGTAWIEGAAILIAVVLVTFVGAFNNYSKELQFRALDKQKENKPVEVVRGGKEMEISSNDLLVGDIVLLKQGERIPADGLYIDGRGTTECKVDTSVMTGETVAVTVNKKSPVLLSGTTIDEGLARMLVIAVGEESQYGILFKNLQVEAEPTPLEEKLDNLANWIGYGGMAAAVMIFGVLLLFFLIDQFTGTETKPHCFSIDSPFQQSFCWYKEEDKEWNAQSFSEITQFAIIAITIVVVAVPEGLPLAVTLSLAYSMKQMMNDNCLVRRLAACETMGGATTICSDKTGTLTENRMTVVQGWIGDQEFKSVPVDFSIAPSVVRLLNDGIAINSKANVAPPASDDIGALPQFMGNKTECALLVFAAAIQPGYDYHEVRMEGEINEVMLFNFNSDRKRMSTVVKTGDKQRPFIMYTKGASEMILERSRKIMTSTGEIRELTGNDAIQLEGLIDRMADEGLRTIGLAYREFDNAEDWKQPEDHDGWEPPEEHLTLLAIVGIKDPIRKEVPHAVQTCQSAGIVVRVVTGDNIKTATRIARDCGILTEEGIAMTGPDFRNLSDAQLDKILPKLQVLARSIPTDKQRLVERLKANRQVVAVTGDGTNDGPALKAAHVGLAMGLSGTDVAKQASDIVILDDNFKSIVLAVMWGRCVYDNIKKFLQFQLTVNCSALSVALVSALTDRGTPLTAIQLLWVNLIMDTMAALALGTEKPTPDLLLRKPYGLDEKVPISLIMWRNILGHAAYQILILLGLIFFGADILDLQDKGEEHYTMVFNTFVWMQIFNEINARKVNNEWNVFHNIWKNWLFIAIFIVTCVFQVLLVELGGEAVKTTGLSPLEWGICVGLGFVSLPLGFVIRFIPVDFLSNWSCFPKVEEIDETNPLLDGEDESDFDSDFNEDDEDVHAGLEKDFLEEPDLEAGELDLGRDKGKGKATKKKNKNRRGKEKMSDEEEDDLDREDAPLAKGCEL